MHEHILAVGPLDETEALGGVKPFDNAFFSHCKNLLNLVSFPAQSRRR